MLTGSNGKNVQCEEEGGFGASIGQQTLASTDNHQDVGYTKDEHTPADKLEAAGLGIGQPTEEDGQNVHHHLEGLGDSIGLDSSHTKGTRGLLSATRWRSPAVSTLGQRSVDEVTEELLHSIVGCSLSELDGTDEVGDSGHRTSNTAEGQKFLRGGFALIVAVQQCMVVSSVRILGRLLVSRELTLW